MTDLEKLCMDILSGRALKDNPELGAQILKECGYNLEKIKEDQERVSRYRASADYEDYLNSIGLESYDVRRDEQAEKEEDEEYL